jgi:rod shape-determining protein MreB
MLSAFKPIMYVQVSPERLVVRNAKTGQSIAEPPEVAIAYGSKAKIVGVGSGARMHQSTASVKVVNPFGHPRSLVSDFTIGEQLLKAFLRRMQGRSVFAVAPKVVLHPQGNPAGGFTQVELRAFHEMALGAGASEVVVWRGRNLTDEELVSGRFPSEGQLLS